MDRWRRQRGEFRRQEFQGARSFNRRPPPANWQPTVPAWEKKFCSAVGSVSWKRVLEARDSSYLYDNVLKWNDSAVEEAFHNAKKRFWAEINGLPCDIPLPDPEIYIDEVDWDSEVNPELLQDLDKDYVPDEAFQGETVVFLGDAVIPSHLFPHWVASGWGDAEENLQKENGGGWGNGLDSSWQVNNTNMLGWDSWQASNNYQGWGDSGVKVTDSWQYGNYNGWGNNYSLAKDSWQDGNYKEGGSDSNKLADLWADSNYKEWGDNANRSTDSWRDGKYKEWGNKGNRSTDSWQDGNYREWGNNSNKGMDSWRDGKYKDWGNRCGTKLKKVEDGRNRSGHWGKSPHWNNNNRGNREGPGNGEMSRYKTSRFHGNNYQDSHGWRKRGGEWKKTNHGVGEKPFVDGKNPAGQWN